MAFKFSMASSQYLQWPAAIRQNGQLTISCWFKATSLPSFQALVTIEQHDDSSAFTGTGLGILGASSKMMAFAQSGGTYSEALTSNTVTIGKWHHAVLLVGTGNMYALLDGVSSSAAGRVLSSSATRTTIGGHYYNGALGSYLDASVAEIAIWNVDLTPGRDTVPLLAGVSPLKIRPENLVGYLPLAGDTIDIVGGRMFTAYNVPTLDSYKLAYMTQLPRMISRQRVRPAVAAAPTFKPWFTPRSRLLGGGM
jgi:hypothetical protein